LISLRRPPASLGVTGCLSSWLKTGGGGRRRGARLPGRAPRAVPDRADGVPCAAKSRGHSS